MHLDLVVLHAKIEQLQQLEGAPHNRIDKRSYQQAIDILCRLTLQARNFHESFCTSIRLQVDYTRDFQEKLIPWCYHC